MSYSKSKSFLPERGRFILFEIGLIIAISAALVAFNYKAEKDDSHIYTLPIPTSGEIEEVVPSTTHKQEMPTPPAPPTDFNILDNEIEIDTEFVIDVEDTQLTEMEEYSFEIPEEVKAEEPVFEQVDVFPEFPGGETARLAWLRSRVRYPRGAVEIGMSGTVYLGFIVGKDGTIRDVTVLRGPGGLLNDEALRVGRMMPNWKPGIRNGVPVNTRFVMPVKFVLQ